MRNAALRRLQVFTAVANRPSFSWAAAELYLTQPTVSMQVQALEDLAGVALFEQIGKKIFLTTAGNELLRHARRIAQQLREADAAMAAIRSVKGGRLNIGVVSTAKYIAPRQLVAFRARHPEVELSLVVENRAGIAGGRALPGTRARCRRPLRKRSPVAPRDKSVLVLLVA